MNPETTHWVHDLDPFLIQFTENFGIRYYGLAYVLGLFIAIGLLKLYWRAHRSPLDPERQSNLTVALVVGVLVGGRLGYMLLYDLPTLIEHPIQIVKIWEGGMASHGGFIGVILALIWFSRRERLPIRPLGDIMVTLVPPGLMLGRIANFINGELWGRVSSVPWAVIFPHSAEPGTPLAQIPPRHPSQLYEAALEGLLLTVWTQWRFWRGNVTQRAPGQLAGEFLLIYAIVRIFGEQFREPDAGLLFGLSRGSFYSIFVAIGGTIVIIWARRAGPVPVPPPPPKQPSTSKPRKP